MRTIALVSLLCAGLLGGGAAATPVEGMSNVIVPAVEWQALLLSQTVAAAPKSTQTAAAPDEQPAMEEAARASIAAGDFKGVNEFFNVREANSDVVRGQWEFGVGAAWQTFYRPRQDHVEMQQYVKYGITDNLYAGLRIFEPLGYGGQGVAELEASIFDTFWREGTATPAIAGFANLRIPTGYQSADVDGQYGLIITKTLFPRFRAHLEGWVMNACGGRADERNWQDDQGVRRRSFQWAVGPGFDYQVADSTLLALNYLQRSSYSEGEHNLDVLELGVVRDLRRTERCRSQLKGAVDSGLAGQDEEPHLGLKLQWELYLK